MYPKIILNCAASADGKIALPNRNKIRLSNETDVKRVEKLRVECDAILIGIGTVLEDNPLLTIKQNTKKKDNPIRIILDTNFRTPINANVVNKESKTIIAVGDKVATNKQINAKIIKCGEKEIDLERLLKKLKKMGIKSLLVEGGETVMWSFLKRNLFDDFYIFISNIIIGGTKTPTIAGGEGIKTMNNISKLSLKNITKLGEGILVKYGPPK